MDADVTLRQWYYAENPKDVTDIPIAPFEEVLFWEVNDPDESIIKIPLAELSPWETRLIVIYCVNDGIDIYGTVTFEEAYYKHGGKVPASALLWKRTTRLTELEDENKSAQPPPLFRWANIFGSMSLFENCEYEDFCKHMIQLFKLDEEEELTAPTPPPPCAIWLASLVGDLLEKESHELRNAYEHMRLSGEKKIFFQLITPFLQSEELMIGLFKHNEQQEWLLGDSSLTSADEESRRDHVWFAANFPTCKRPTFYWKVPMWDMPQDLALSMPIYEGGILHVPYTCIHLWLWHTFESYAQVAASRRKGKFEDPWLERWIRNAKENFVQYWKVREWKQKRKNPPLLVQAKKLPMDRFSPKNIKQSFLALLRLLPPCISNVYLAQGRFPWHAIRTYIVQILRAAGWTKELIEKFFDDWNEACPKTPYETLAQRFSVKTAVEYADKIGAEKVHNCGNIISATMKGNEDKLVCPFAQELSGDKRQCKQKCCGKANVIGPHEIIAERLIDIEDLR